MRADRHRKHKKIRKVRWKRVFFVLFLLCIVIFGFSYYQFKQGMKEANKEAAINQEKYEFNGKKDQYGGTNILVLGSDARGNEKSRSDTIMIAHYVPDQDSYKIISIMRDCYVNIPGHGKNKINAAFAFGGPELLRKTIKENFNIDLQYYTIVDFQGFVHLVDTAFPEGVKMDVEKKMSADVELEPGVQMLDGEHLLGYVRFRHDAVGDFGRVARQQKVLKEVADQITSVQTVPKLPKLVGGMIPFINTNMDTGDILFMGKNLLMNKNRTIETLRIPVDHSFDNDRISGIGDVLTIDLEANKAAIDEFLGK